MKQKFLRGILIVGIITAFTACNHEKEKFPAEAVKGEQPTASKADPDAEWMKTVNIYLDRNMAFLNMYNFVHAHSSLPAAIVTEYEAAISEITNSNNQPPEKNPSPADIEKFKLQQQHITVLATRLLDYYQQHKELQSKENAAVREAELSKAKELTDKMPIEYKK